MSVCCCQTVSDRDANFQDFILSKSKLISVNTVVNDLHEGVFVLDNGSNECTLDSAFFYDNFDVSKYKIWKQHRNLKYELGTGKIKFSIGNHSFSIQDTFTIRNLKRQGVSGLIGFVAFKNQITIINFDENKIAFVDTFDIPSDYHKISLYSPHSHSLTYLNHLKYIYISGFQDVKGKNITGHFLFDLGSTFGISSKHKFFNIIQKDTSRVDIGYMQTVHTPKPNERRTYYIDSLYIDSCIKIQNVPINITIFALDPKIDIMADLRYGDGLLGLKILSNFNLIYDAPNDVLYIKPNNKYFESKQ
jgi:hypothetical protein